MSNLRIRMLGLIVAMAAFSAVAQQAPSKTSEFTLGQDRFTAGDQVTVAEAIGGDLIAVGGKVNVSGDIAGTLIAAGGEVQLNGPARHDVYAAGRQITLSAVIEHNARIAGGMVNLQPAARIDGNASLAGRELNLAGEVKGYLLAAGGRIYINGPIGGDVQAAGGEIELGPNARIEGSFRYRSKNELKRAPSAQIQGQVERAPWPEHDRSGFKSAIVGLVVWTLGLAVLAAMLLTVLPTLTRRVSETARAQFGWSLLWGLIVLIGTPLAVVVAMITVIGIPLGLLLLLSYPIVLLIGYVLAGVAVGDAGLFRFKPESAANVNHRILAAALALLVLALAARIPVLGALVCFAALLAGTGALIRQVRGSSAHSG